MKIREGFGWVVVAKSPEDPDPPNDHSGLVSLYEWGAIVRMTKIAPNCGCLPEDGELALSWDTIDRVLLFPNQETYTKDVERNRETYEGKEERRRNHVTTEVR